MYITHCSGHIRQRALVDDAASSYPHDDHNHYSNRITISQRTVTLAKSRMTSRICVLKL